MHTVSIVQNLKSVYELANDYQLVIS